MSNASDQYYQPPAHPEPPRCYVCGRSVGDRWFSRICRGQTQIHICSPACSILFTSAPTPPSDPEKRKRFYQEQDQLLKAREADAGYPNSYDTTLARAPY